MLEHLDSKIGGKKWELKQTMIGKDFRHQKFSLTFEVNEFQCCGVPSFSSIGKLPYFARVPHSPFVSCPSKRENA